jgi:kumamolisin
MSTSGWVPVEGSARSVPEGDDLGPVDPTEVLEVTVVLEHPTAGLGEHVASLSSQPRARRRLLTREQLRDEFGAAVDDVELVRRFAAQQGVVVGRVDRAARSVVLRGTVAQMTAAFGVELRSYRTAAGTIRGRSGAVLVPDWLAPRVQGVFGLDTRVQARAHFRVASSVLETAFRPAAAPAQSFTPVELATVYDFPDGTGAGQTIALIELGGGFEQADLDTYFAGLGISPPPQVTAVVVDGVGNSPTGDPNGADGEVVLDIEVAGAVAPGAQIVVYFAPNTDKGFLDAVNAAVHDTTHDVSVISISWGGPESSWTTQALDAMSSAFLAASALGISVFCASGDNGSSDGETDDLAHVDFPASRPAAGACGGTTLRTTGTTIASEAVWNGSGATGGGVSDHFGVPSYQATINPTSANPGAHHGRGVPDVAADADPETGYQVLVDGKAFVIGGTSAVAPLWAGLTARLQQSLGQRLAPIQPDLYAAASGFHDIVAGTNGSYQAAPGWDPCTGLGSPDGQALLAALSD